MATKTGTVSASKRATTMDEAYALLSADMPEAAIERSVGLETGKGYDTTGFGYQYCVNRFNEVLGLAGWGFSYEMLSSTEGLSSGGKKRFILTVETKVWVKVGEESAERVCAGGHVSNNYADALKGAITNSFKKTAALFGVGKAAYEGSVDDDNKPEDANVKAEVKSTATPQNRATAARPAPVSDGPVTEKQMGMINALINKKGVDREKIKEHYKVKTLTDLSAKDASKLIKQLDLKPDAPIAGEVVIDADE